MLHASYEMLGLGIVGLLAVIWMIKRRLHRRRVDRMATANCAGEGAVRHNQDVEHRALMYLMTQKTDALLSALARTIEQERQKLGVVVRNPSLEKALDALQTTAPPADQRPLANVDSILPLARQGMDTMAIARRLRLPEAEVALVMRLKAA